MNRTNGRALSEDEHLAQSMGDIITTPIGTRLKRRDYGSIVPMLLDQPITRATPLLLVSAITIALTRWEKRVTVRKVTFTGDFASGQAQANITVQRRGGASNALTTQAIPLPLAR